MTAYGTGTNVVPVFSTQHLSPNREIVILTANEVSVTEYTTGRCENMYNMYTHIDIQAIRAETNRPAEGAVS